MPSDYSILLTSQAKKELSKIKRGNIKSARLIINALEQLQQKPALGEFLHGDLKGRRKLRVGDYRVVYSIEKDKLIVFILRIAHRKDVYK